MQQFSSSFFALADAQGAIYVQDVQGTRQIGVSVEKYREMERLANDAVSKAEAYHQQLVDAGIIKPKLTTEQQLDILTQQNTALTEQVSALTQQISTLMKGGKNEFSDACKGHSSEEQPTHVESGAGAADCGTVQPDKKRRP